MSTFDLTNHLIKRFVPDSDQLERLDIRARHGFLEAWTSIVINSVLFVVKIVLGVLANSVSLISDAFHTLGDLVGSVVVLVGFRVAKTPADLRHPYGHGRAEPIATLIIAMLLVVAAVEFAHLSFDRLLAPEPLTATWIVVFAMVVSIALKEWLARFSNRLGDLIDSDMLRADAWHHRTDVVAAGLVVAAMIGGRLGYPALDGLFGLGVSALIGLTGFSMARGMVSRLLGEAPDRETVQQIADTAQSVRGVRGVHDIAVHDYGSAKHVSLHVEVTPDSTTEESHATANSVEDTLGQDLMISAVVHVDVADRGFVPPSDEAVRQTLTELAGHHPAVRGFHGLQTMSDENGPYVELHMTLDPAVTFEVSHDLVHHISRHIAEQTGVTKVNIHVEPHGEGK